MEQFLATMLSFVVYFVVYFVLFVATLIVAAIIGGVPVLMKNDATGHAKYIRPRVSFTYLFFGFWVPLFRGHWSSFGITLALDIFTAGFGRLIYCFFINKSYIKHLENKGYQQIVVTYNVQSTVVNSDGTTTTTTTQTTEGGVEEVVVNLSKDEDIVEEVVVNLSKDEDIVG